MTCVTEHLRSKSCDVLPIDIQDLRNVTSVTFPFEYCDKSMLLHVCISLWDRMNRCKGTVGTSSRY